jgi:hypothetical protein
MTQALIKINTVAGPNTDLPINTLVQLDNANTGGEVTYLWTILSQPPGVGDALSNVAIQNPTLTPRKEGTYLLQLIVNQSLPSEQRDQTVVGIRQLKTRQRVPAAGESDEAGIAGWAEPAINGQLRALDAWRADPGVIVGVLHANSAVGAVHRVSAIVSIKVGLPGEEQLPELYLFAATSVDVTTTDCFALLAAVDGGTLTAGKLCYFRAFGLVFDQAVVGATLNDLIYISDAGVFARVTGTNNRIVGRCVRVPAVDTADVYFNGLGRP